VKDKYTDEAIGRVPSLSVAQLSTAIEVGYNAFLKYSKSLRLYQRAEILAKASRLLQERNEDFAKLIAREAGKPIKYSRKEAKRAS
jgi:acyl-CoA reductase-like NAD-dependent aldehyde dehydrogenase